MNVACDGKIQYSRQRIAETSYNVEKSVESLFLDTKLRPRYEEISNINCIFFFDPSTFIVRKHLIFSYGPIFFF